MGIGPYGETGKLHRPPGPAAHSEAYALRSRGMGGNRSRDHPQSTQQRRAIPQSRRSRASSCCGTQNSLLAYAHRILTAATPFCSLLPPLAALANVPLYTREPLGTGDADCRVASLLAMTVLILCHSEEAQRADVGIRSFLRWTGVRAAEIVGPYGKKGKLPRPPGQRLAKRKARKEQLVKFDFCPMTSECSTAHNARRFQQSSARAPVGTAITEQDRLAPHPAARQGAPRP